ncbi:ABC transporter substrate-binding protein [Virgibacillus necropolis]|uniref:ABC transporter substrate-binding protein n=1 Tax=Virgibacillus necropolis TaxID=163877 RepID=A0A221M9J1_9BACI|nr:ABC transporter substrate-binding protein [Virgibacillus necropolis]ASN04314.1 ABC transporter substrate-binding protein [Virgibacillus necropolis]
MLKKYLSLLLIVALFGILAACGNDSEKSSSSVTLDVQYYTEAISDGAIEAAKEEFSDYTLNFTEVPADDTYDVKLRTSLDSDSAPDIVTINSNIQEFLPYADKFVNFLDYDVESLAENYVEWKWESAKTADKSSMIAMLIDIGPTALFYRIDLFEKAGLPTDPQEVSNTIVTSEDYMEAAKTLSEEIDKPMFLSAVALLGEEYRKLNSSMYNKEGELTLADGKLKEIWDYTVKAVNEGYTLGTRANTIDNVVAQNKGLYGAYIGASWGVLDVKDAKETKGKWRIAKAPGGYSNQGGSYLAVLGNSDHPEEAVEVVKYLTNFDSQLANLTENSLFPSHQEVYDTEAMVNKDEWFGGQNINEYFIEAAENIEYVYRDPRDSAAFTIFTDEIHLVESQNKDPEEAWNDAVKKAEQL